MANPCRSLQSRSTAKENCSSLHCQRRFPPELTRSRSVFPVKSTSRGRDFFTCVIRSRGVRHPPKRKSCSARNLKRPMLADFSLVGTNRSEERRVGKEC